MDDGLRSRNKIKIHSKPDRFLRKGNKLRSLDNFIKLTINGKQIAIDDIDIDLGQKPYIKIYGDIEFMN